jgi:hypothetical protein
LTDDSYNIDLPITAGVLFFQAVNVWVQPSSTRISSNVNAIPGTVWRTPASQTEGVNPFALTAMNLPVAYQEYHGLYAYYFNLSNMDNTTL